MLSRTAWASWLGLAAVLAMGVCAWGQDEPAGELPGVRAMVARREANMVRVNGVPKVLTWARGLEDTKDLDRYAALRLNTAYLVIREVSEEELSAVSSLASAAEARGLMVVGALAPPVLRDEEGEELAVYPWSEEYGAAVEEFVSKAVEGLGEHRGVIAWSVEAAPPERVVWDDVGFGTYLEEWYASLEALNGSWGTEFSDWEEITAGGVRDIDATRLAGLGRASVDFAYYREAAYADTLSVWAQAIREADPGRLVFASALTDYRSVISVRTDFDGMILNAYPSRAEADWQTHNVHAVDIGRRANQFAVIQTLEVSAGTEAERLGTWAALALQHGAAGVALSSWGAVRDSEALGAAVGEMVRGIESLGYYPAEPRPRAAILYEPIAGGAMRNGQGLYGYLDGFAPNEPSTLFAVGRNGSRFGQFDVLSVESVGEVDLGQYGVVIAPMALYLPDDVQVALHGYVLRGGVLVADAGIGMYQGAGVVTSVPTIMKDVLGVRYDVTVEEAWAPEVPGEVQVGGPGETGAGPPAVGTGLPEAPILGYDSDVMRLAGVLEEELDRPAVAEYLGTEFLAPDAPELRVHPLGQGFSVYSPVFLYDAWDASDPYFAAFHARLLAHGSDLEVVEPAGVWPGVSAGAYRDWSVGLASPNGAATSVVVYGGGNQVYQVPSGAMRLGNPEEVNRVELLFPGALLSVARPVPIYVMPWGEGAVATVSVVEYGADRIELLVHGSGAQARVGREGVEVQGGVGTPIEIEIESGRYRVARGSTHRLVVEEGRGGTRGWEQEVMPNEERGTLVVRGTFTWARVIIEPTGE